LGGTLLSNWPASADDASRAAAVQLFQSLTASQRQEAARDWDDKERNAIRFVTEKTGTPISKMSDEQKKLVDDLMRTVLSEFGWKRCLEMGGSGRVTFFGTPGGRGERFACRIDKNAHLTLMYVEFGKEPGGEFGPICLGAKGAGVETVWVEDDRLALALAANLSPDDAARIKDKKSKGIAIGELSDQARSRARGLLEQRLAIFSPPSRKIVDDAIQSDGGVDKLRIHLVNDASKSIDDGGNYNWSITGASFSCTWQYDGKKHPHMTLQVKRGR
jgi:hypothetical protein